MDAEKNIKNPQAQESKRCRNWKESHTVFLVLPLVLTILFPLGGIFYLCGRFCPYAAALGHVCILYPVIWSFIIYCLARAVVRLYRRWRGHTCKRKLLGIAEVAIPVVFLGLLAGSFLLPESEFLGYGYKFFMYGLRDRTRSKADVEAVREWLRTRHGEDNVQRDRIAREEWPKSLKQLHCDRVFLSQEKNGNSQVRLLWGSGPLGHWGIEIGMANMEIPPSDFSEHGEYRLPVEPGVYVWWAFE